MTIQNKRVAAQATLKNFYYDDSTTFLIEGSAIQNGFRVMQNSQFNTRGLKRLLARKGRKFAKKAVLL